MLNTQKQLIQATLAMIGSALFLVGCGSGDGVAIGKVTGTVTFDEQPLAGAMITFVPVDNVKESYAYTDENGHYELEYKQGIQGAYVGQHHIRITTATEDQRNEKLPVRYHRQTELTSVVEKGANKIDFDLTSESEKQ